MANEKRPRPERKAADTYTAFDRKMVWAVQAHRPVEFIMATGTVVIGYICSVDKYFIEIEDGLGKVWLNKAAMESARVQ